MRISVQVKPGSKKGPLVEQIEDKYVVFLKQRAIDGAANEGLIELLAEHFGVKKAEVVIESGFTSRLKRVRIGGPKGT